MVTATLRRGTGRHHALALLGLLFLFVLLLLLLLARLLQTDLAGRFGFLIAGAVTTGRGRRRRRWRGRLRRFRHTAAKSRATGIWMLTLRLIVLSRRLRMVGPFFRLAPAAATAQVVLPGQAVQVVPLVLVAPAGVSQWTPAKLALDFATFLPLVPTFSTVFWLWSPPRLHVSKRLPRW